MSYQVIARRWRPQNFDEIVYQDHVSKTIANSIKNNRISHSYIFTGPRGVGKTTTARILAKSLNCIHGPTPEPCGVCDNCIEIKDGTSFDVIEIDGASNNSVDNIRDLREKVNFAPVKGNYKVYIIDEVHMLSKGAFNALLKTLEEPPEHVIFIFATTEIHKVPDTILSRCQKFFFKKITVDVVVEHLKKIVKSEGMTVEEGALFSIARASGGSMRDAQSLLEQVISFSDGNIKNEDALSVLGIVSFGIYFNIFQFINTNNSLELFNEVEKLITAGVDIERFSDGLQEYIRALRLIIHAIPVENLINYSKEEIDNMKIIAGNLYDEELSRFYEITIRLLKNLKISNNERINLEMALMDMLGIKNNPSISEIIKKITEFSPEQGTNEIKKKVLNDSVPIAPTAIKSESISNTNKVEASVPGNNNSIKEIWQNFLTRQKAVKQYLYVKLVKAPVEFDEKKIIIRPNNQNGQFNTFLDSRDIQYINDELNKISNYKIDIIFDKVKQVDSSDELIPEAQMMKQDDFSKLEQKHPVVQKVMELFYGEIVEKGDK